MNQPINQSVNQSFPQMPEAFIQPLLCPRCQVEVRDTDNYCHACGKSLKPGRGFLFTHGGIILMALVLGPLALPFVWMSKVISPTAKVIYTVVLLVIGFYLVFSLWKAFNYMNNSLQMMMGDLNNLGNVSNLGGLRGF